MLKTIQNTSLKAPIETESATVAKRDRLVLGSEDRDRAVAFGEALRAIWQHVGTDMVSPPGPQLLEVLEVAYRELGSALDDFTPQDFTLYAMSLLLMDLDDEDQITRLKRGAARYLLNARSQFSPELRNLVPDVQVSLNSATARTEGSRRRPDMKQKAMSPPRKDWGRVNVPLSGNNPRKAGVTVSSSIDVDSFVFKHTPLLDHPPAPQTARQAGLKSGGDKSEEVSNRFQTARNQSKSRIGFSLIAIVFSLIFVAISFT